MFFLIFNFQRFLYPWYTQNATPLLITDENQNIVICKAGDESESAATAAPDLKDLRFLTLSESTSYSVMLL